MKVPGSFFRQARRSFSTHRRGISQRLRQAAFEALEGRTLLSITPVLSNHYDAGTTGQDLNETLLTPTNVNSTDFGRIFDTPLDGQVFAQPLAVPNVNITTGANQGIHNVLYVATMHDSLFAVDATTGTILWQDSFLQINGPQVATIGSPVPTAGVTTVPGVSGDNALVNSSDVGPELGILSTPVINPSTGILYVDATTQELRNGQTPVSTFTSGTTDIHYVQRLWAINIADGSVAFTPPNASIEPTSKGFAYADSIKDPTSGSVPAFSTYNNYQYVTGPIIKGTGNNNDTFNSDGTIATTNDADGWTTTSSSADPNSQFKTQTPAALGDIAFNGLLQMNRVAVTLINGTIYLGFASHGDDGPYYGWLLGYNASNFSQTAAFVTVPTYDGVKGSASYTSVGGLWGAGATITTDGTYLYLSVGNGSFNPAASNFSASYESADGSNAVMEPRDGDYGDTVLKLAVDTNATQSNINLKTDSSGAPTTSYNPDGGFDEEGFGLKVVDFFAPSNVYEMNDGDEDVGSGGVLMIPATKPNGTNWLSDGDTMLVLAGKEGRVYLLDSGNLGGYNTAYDVSGNPNTGTTDPDTYDRILGEYYYKKATGGAVANDQTYKGYDIPSYYNGNIYIGLGGGSTGTKYLPEWQIPVSSLLAGSVPPGTSTAAASSIASTSATFGGRGTTAAISANGSSNAIVWNTDVTQSATDDLLAYTFPSGAGTATTLFDTQANSARDSLTNGGTVPSGSMQGNGGTGATGAKFGVPVVFNGMVYDGTGGSSGTGGHAEGTLVGYGLLPSYLAGAGLFGAPTNLGAGFQTTTDVRLTWTAHSTQEDEFEIDRSTNAGSSWAVIGYVQHGVTSFDDLNATEGTNYEYRVRAVSGGTINTSSPQTTAADGTTYATVNIGGTPPTLESAVSRKTINSVNYDIGLALTGSPTTEDRVGGPTQLVITFGAAIEQGPNYQVTLSEGSVNNSNFNGSTLTINVYNIPDKVTTTVTISGLEDVSSGGVGNYSFEVAALLGDVNGDGSVTTTDVALAKQYSGQPLSGTNFRADVNESGAINVNDVNIVKASTCDTVSSGDEPALALATDAATAAPASATAATGNTPAVEPPIAPPSVQAGATDDILIDSQADLLVYNGSAKVS